MAHLKAVTYWENNRGRKHDITLTSNDYIINCLCFLQKRRDQAGIEIARHEGCEGGSY